MRTKRLSIILILMVFLLSLAAPGAWAYSTKYKLMGFSGTAGEVLTTGTVVCIADADGLIYKADANDATRQPAVGVVGLQARAIGDKVEVITHGIFRGWTTLSEGASGYLSETAGAITQTSPTYSQKIGVAISTTEYLINCQEYIDTSALTALGVLSGATPIILEGATPDAFESTIATEDPTADNTITVPNYSGAVPLVIAQGYTQTSNGDASALDVTGSSITLADGWFAEGKTLKYTLGGTVTGANGAVSVILYLEDGAVMTLTSADGAAGDWTAEFTVVAVSATAQRIIGVLRAEGGAEVITDYATDNTAIGAAGTIPVKAQINLANAADVITNEYVRIEAWSKAD
ncbi:MAG: hypothetical protein HY911_04485 [Desulfobacterales bacterium]|nr:hypothetical protein [Desulfobacterales bacterium]